MQYFHQNKKFSLKAENHFIFPRFFSNSSSEVRAKPLYVKLIRGAYGPWCYMYVYDMTSLRPFYGIDWTFITTCLILFFLRSLFLSLNLYLFLEVVFPSHCLPTSAVAGSFSVNLPVAYWSGCAMPELVQKEAAIYYPQSSATLGLH